MHGLVLLDEAGFSHGAAHGQAELDGEAGERAASFDCDGWRVGLSICYDLRFPELYRALMHPPCDLIVVPAAFAVSWAIYRLLLTPLVRRAPNRDALEVDSILATFGMLFVIQGVMLVMLSTNRCVATSVSFIERSRLTSGSSPSTLATTSAFFSPTAMMITRPASSLRSPVTTGRRRAAPRP